MEEGRYRRRLWPLCALRVGTEGKARLEVSGGRATLRVDARGLKDIPRVRLLLLGQGRWVEAQRAPVEKDGSVTLLLDGSPRLWPLPPEETVAVALAEDSAGPALLLEGGERGRSEQERVDARMRLLTMLTPVPAKQPAPSPAEEGRRFAPSAAEKRSAAISALTLPRRRAKRIARAERKKDVPDAAASVPLEPSASTPALPGGDTPSSLRACTPCDVGHDDVEDTPDAALHSHEDAAHAPSQPHEQHGSGADSPDEGASPAPRTPDVPRDASMPPSSLPFAHSSNTLHPPPSTDLRIAPSARSALAPLPREVRLPALEAVGLLCCADAACLHPASPCDARTAAHLPAPASVALPPKPLNRMLAARPSPPLSPAVSARRRARPLGALPTLHWPQEVRQLKQYFDTMEPFMPFDAPGWRFVRVPLSGGDAFALGVQIRGGAVAGLCYAVPGDKNQPPPPALTGYRWQQGLAGVGYWTLWQRVDQRFHSASHRES